MAQTKKMIIPEVCTRCGEKGTIFQDDTLGEIACEDCGLVYHMGLFEPENESTYHDDQVKSTKMQSSLRHDHDKKYTRQVTATLRDLSIRFDPPESVLRDAEALTEEYLIKLENQGKAGGKPDGVALAIAIFHVSSLRMHYPLARDQLLQQLGVQNLDLQVRDLVRDSIPNALSNLEMPDLERVVEDYVSVILEKIQHNPLEPMKTMATTLARLYPRHVASQFEPRVYCALSIYFCFYAKDAKETLCPRVCAHLGGALDPKEVTPRAAAGQKEQLQAKLVQAISSGSAIMMNDESSTSGFKSCFENLQGQRQVAQAWVKAACDMFSPPQEAAAAAAEKEVKSEVKVEVKTEKESGQRRDRE